MSGALQLVDPIDASPHPAQGNRGKLVLGAPVNAKAITPGAGALADAGGNAQPMQIWVGGAGGTVTISPAGNGGDSSVTFTVAAGGSVPCVAAKVTAATATGLVGVW